MAPYNFIPMGERGIDHASIPPIYATEWKILDMKYSFACLEQNEKGMIF